LTLRRVVAVVSGVEIQPSNNSLLLVEAITMKVGFFVAPVVNNFLLPLLRTLYE
jgi:hypothetical protein